MCRKSKGLNALHLYFYNTIHMVINCFVFRPAETVSEGSTPAIPDTLWRRYSEFELLRSYLLVTYPYIVIPPLPEKRVSCTNKSLKFLFWLFCDFHFSHPFHLFSSVVPFVGGVCVAQAVSRQPRPRLCWASESWPGKLPVAGCISFCPFQW